MREKLSLLRAIGALLAQSLNVCISERRTFYWAKEDLTPRPTIP